MKQGEGRDVAHDLYVYELMTFDEIAQRTGRTEKTIRKWATEGGWREERERLMTAKTKLHEKLYTLTHKIADKFIEDYDKGDEPSSHRMHAFTNILRMLKNAYSYEDELASAETEAARVEQPKASPEELVDRVREVLGV